MAKRRDSKGRFRKGTRGFGTIITVKRGMGALPGGAMGEAIIAPAVGGLTAALVALAIRHFVVATEGETQAKLVRWAPLLGGLAGAVSSLALFMLGGMNAAVSSIIAATGVTVGLYGHDMILERRSGEILGALAASSAAPAGTAGYRRRMGAIVPEYSRRLSGMNGVVMEPVGPSGRRAGTLGRARDYGEVVSLGALNTGAFGTPSFRA